MSITRECRKGKARNKECQHLWVDQNEDDFAAVGSLAQQCNIEWIFSLYRYLGCNVLEAELWGILDGLNLSLDQGFKYILIQTDSCKAVNAIQEAFVGDSKSALIRRIHRLLSKVLHWSIQPPSR
ncbi:hypothetical protein Godav_010248 [Gossypium davidsonii]|uniref:RNase H type-1 domain-containing protein n=1 Tax=Gossypium davidsonii TaxID=34287 RepID=A0A7J8SFX6_GOSDV|nr:hypothetical protein [Gossypium davidsonii]